MRGFNSERALDCRIPSPQTCFHKIFEGLSIALGHAILLLPFDLDRLTGKNAPYCFRTIRGHFFTESLLFCR